MENRTVMAILEHKFDLSKMESIWQNEDCYGPVTSIVHKGVNRSFRFGIRTKGSRACKDHIGLYIYYVDGPTDVLKMGYSLFVGTGPEWGPFCLLPRRENEFPSANYKYRPGRGAKLPRTLERLRQQGYLCRDALLHVSAILFIPEAAFDDPKKLCPPSSAQNQFHQHLYLETDTPSATNWPSNRFEMISNDGHHFWVHKEVLAFNSDTFKQMFDSSKPEDARFDYLREGRMTLGNASGGALKEMITYLYLQHTTPDFDQFAMELVPLAEMYGLKGLGLLCHETLFVQAENRMDVDELLQCHEFAQLHELGRLRIKSVKRLEEEVLKDQNDVDLDQLLKVTEQAHKHEYDRLMTVCRQKLVEHVNESEDLSVSIVLDLATESLKYELNDLTLACAQWVNRDWQTVSNDGDLSDICGEIFARLMALAEVKKCRKTTE